MSILPKDVWWTIGTFLEDAFFIVLHCTSASISTSIGKRKFKIPFWPYEYRRDRGLNFKETIDLYRWSIQMGYVSFESHYNIRDLVMKNLNIEFYKLAITIRNDLYKDPTNACDEAIKLGRFDIFCLIYHERLKMEGYYANEERRLDLLKRAVELVEETNDEWKMNNIVRSYRTAILGKSIDSMRFGNYNDRNDEKDLSDMSDWEQEDYWKRL